MSALTYTFQFSTVFSPLKQHCKLCNQHQATGNMWQAMRDIISSVYWHQSNRTASLWIKWSLHTAYSTIFVNWILCYSAVTKHTRLLTVWWNKQLQTPPPRRHVIFTAGRHSIKVAFDTQRLSESNIHAVPRRSTYRALPDAHCYFVPCESHLNRSKLSLQSHNTKFCFM